MAFQFTKPNDPDYQKKKKEREKREQQMIEWRKITVGATGHRPDKMGGWKDSLGGYDNQHSLVVSLKTVLLQVIENLIVNQGKTRFISGGALGFDSMFFWSVNHLKKKYPEIKNVVAIPFKNQHIRWQEKQRYWYFEMLKRADDVIDVARHEDYCTHEHKKTSNPISLDDYSNEKMKKRNEFMVDQSGILVAFFDGSKGGTFHCVNYAFNNIIHRPQIIRLDPRFKLKPEYF